MGHETCTIQTEMDALKKRFKNELGKAITREDVAITKALFERNQAVKERDEARKALKNEATQKANFIEQTEASEERLRVSLSSQVECNRKLQERGHGLQEKMVELRDCLDTAESERDAAREEIVLLQKVNEAQVPMLRLLGEKKDKALQCQNEALRERNEARKRVEELEETIVWIREKIKNGDGAWEKHEIITRIQKECDQAKTILASAVLMLEEAQAARDKALLTIVTLEETLTARFKTSETAAEAACMERERLGRERVEATARANECVVIVDKMTEEQSHTKTELKSLRAQCAKDKEKFAHLIENERYKQCSDCELHFDANELEKTIASLREQNNSQTESLRLVSAERDELRAVNLSDVSIHNEADDKPAEPKENEQPSLWSVMYCSACGAQEINNAWKCNACDADNSHSCPGIF